MASPVVQSASEATNQNNAPTITEPSGAVSGDLLIAVIGSSDAATAITGLTGWTQLGEGDDSQGNRFWYGWIIRGASAPDLQAAAANANWVAMCVRIDGHDATTPIGSDHATNTGNSVNPDCPNVNPGSSDDYLSVLGVVQEGKNDNRFTDTLPTGYTEHADIGTTGGGAGTAHVGGAMNSDAHTGQARNPGTHTSSRNDGWIAIHMLVSPSGGLSLTETLQEDIGVTDETPVAQRKRLSEAVGIADSTTRVHTAKRTVTEAVGVTDETPVAQRKRISEAVGVTDSVSPVKRFSITINEAIGITDSTPVKQSKVLTEPVGISDATARATTTKRTITEPVGVADETPVAQRKRISEAVGVADSTADVLKQVIAETVTEAIGVADSTEHRLDAARVVAEPIGISDTTTPARIIRVTINESIGITDTTAPAKSISVEITEPVGVSDVIATARTLAREITEPIGLADDNSPARMLVREITDGVGVADTTLDDLTTSGGPTIQVTINEKIGVTDQVGASPWWAPDPVGISPAPVGIDRRTPGKSSPGI